MAIEKYIIDKSDLTTLLRGKDLAIQPKGCVKGFRVEIAGNLTNGDVIKALFNIPDNDIDEGLSTTYIYTKTRVLKGGSQDHLREWITFNRDWWNAPYKAESEVKA